MHLAKPIALFCVLLATLPVQGADAPAPAEGIAKIRQMRNEARAMSGKSASPAELAGAAATLEAALLYLRQPEVVGRALEAQAMSGRVPDLQLDLAAIYARLGRKEDALAALEAMQRVVYFPLGPVFAREPAFNTLKDDPRFKAVLARTELPGRLLGNKAFATPYKEVLSAEERVAGLSLFWSEARQNMVHFPTADNFDWDRIYLDYLGKVMAATSTREYYRIMMQLAPLLQDGHTNVSPPSELVDEFYARPPIRTVLLENKVLVESVRSPSLAQRVRPGDEIVAIDGQPALQYAQASIAPFVSSSTPQDRAMRTYTYQLLSGSKAAALTLRLRGADGAERTESVARGGYTDIGQTPRFVFKMLPGEIAYFTLENFESADGVKAFEAALPEIMKAKALIIDVRHNGGGSTNYGTQILSYLSKEPVPSALSSQRANDPIMRAGGGAVLRWDPVSSGRTTDLKRGTVFSGKVALLIGAETFSAAEDFVMAFDSMRRGPLVGQATGGSTGQPMNFPLPGGGKARICVKYDTYPDGREFVGVGIKPSIEVAPTVADLRAGRDVVLDRAVDALTK